MVNVVVTRPRTVRVSTNATAGILDSTTPVTIKNVPTLTGNVSLSLEQLNDVATVEEVDGDTLVYDSTTRKWTAQKLNLEDVIGNLDGGTF